MIQIPACRPALGAAEAEAVREVLESRWLSIGEQTLRFESELAEYLGVRHVIAVTTGTAALELALRTLDLKAGDEVIVPSLTFAATAQAIVQAGGRPVFCDIDAATLNMDPDDAARRITARTRALLPVHYGGYACEMERIGELARERSLAVVEDAAHAFGSEYKGRRIGSLGNLACFSFNPVKNITCGEGGAIVTGDDGIAARLRLLRNLGIGTPTWQRMGNARFWEYSVEGPGGRYAMPNLNAAIGLAQFARRAEFQRCKQAAVRRYAEAFAANPHVRPVREDVSGTFPYSCVVRVLNGRRDALAGFLKSKGIGSTVHYIPNHTQPAFREFGAALPVTEQAYEEILSLPLYSDIGEQETAAVIAAVEAFFSVATNA